MFELVYEDDAFNVVLAVAKAVVLASNKDPFVSEELEASFNDMLV